MFCFFVLLYIIMVYYIRKSIYHATIHGCDSIFHSNRIAIIEGNGFPFYTQYILCMVYHNKRDLLFIGLYGM